MKQLFLIIILFVCFSNHGLYAWEGSVKLFVLDNIGRIDSVLFGVNYNSTLDIDSTLGEKNIFNLAFDSLDIRVIQRDSTNHICGGYNYSSNAPQNLYFSDNSDSKIDFRPFSGFHSLNNNFEIYINAIEFPITLIAEYTGITGGTSDLMAGFYFLDNNCQRFRDEWAYLQNDTLAIISDNSFTSLVVNFQHEVGVKDYKEIAFQWETFPNPTNSELTITSKNKIDGTFKIFDINGKLLKNIFVENTKRVTIDMQDIPKGHILISYLDRKTKLKTSKRLMVN